jgi:hypothetical protein
MSTSMRFSRTASAIAVALGLASASAVAQDTSASMRGSIVGPTGEGAANTRVIIEHVPSGSRLEVTTDETGNFIASGLRVGGPYRVTLDSDLYRDTTYSEVFLKLGETYRLTAQLEQSNVERITVTGAALNPASMNSGSTSSFGEDNIRNMPTFNRDLKDIIRQNPLAVNLADEDSSLTVAGSNPKYNSITVDGIGQNDDFGLNGNGYPTQRSPISVAAVEQLSIDVVPFSAKDGGFSGAKINAVTKSGTNEFEGEVFYEYTSDSLTGNPDASRYEPDAAAPDLDFSEKTWGFAVGGPIIKDKLFFFVNYEKYEEPKSVERGPIGAAANQQASVTQDEVDQITQIARDVYGVDVGTWNANPVQEYEKILVKLDWNINNNHRAAFTYQTAESNATNNNGGSSSTLPLSSRWYDKSEKLDAMALQVYSNWTSNFSSDIKLSRKNVETAQAPLLGLNFGQVNIRTADGTVQIGPDQYRHANALENTTTEFQFNGEYLTGDHAIGFGYEYEEVDIFNLFVPASLGVWDFDTIADFENQEAAYFAYRNAFTNNANDGAASLTPATHAFYIEDTWTPSWDLEVSFGLRYERQSVDGTPRYNQNFEDRYGFANTENLDGRDIWMPRAGFKYQLNDNYRLRGGFGRYAGGRPNVWISNAYSVDGVTVVDAPFSVTSNYQSGVDITTIPQEVRDSLTAGDGNTTPIDPNFELPNEWRYSLGLDYEGDLGFLGEDWYASAEYIRTRKQNDVRWVDLARRPLTDADGNVVTTADGGRIIYVVDDPLDNFTPTEPGEFGGVDRYDVMLTNGYGGNSNIYTFSLGKAFDNGISLNTSYTHQDVNEAVNGGSSQAASNYQYVTALDRQNPLPATAGYEIEHRFVITAQYSTELFAGYESKFAMFFERVSGRPFSYVMSSFRDSDLGDQSAFNRSSQYLAYIPTGPNDPNVVYEGGLTYDDLAQIIADKGLEQYAGGYTGRNEARGPWNTNIDLRFEQELPGFWEGHKGALYLDVKNVVALFDKDSAQQHVIPFADTTQGIVDFGGLTDEGQYIYAPVFGGLDDYAPTRYRAEASTWQVKVGVRYNF